MNGLFGYDLDWEKYLKKFGKNYGRARSTEQGRWEEGEEGGREGERKLTDRRGLPNGSVKGVEATTRIADLRGDCMKKKKKGKK